MTRHLLRRVSLGAVMDGGAAAPGLITDLHRALELCEFHLPWCRIQRGGRDNIQGRNLRLMGIQRVYMCKVEVLVSLRVYALSDD